MQFKQVLVYRYSFPFWLVLLLFFNGACDGQNQVQNKVDKKSSVAGKTPSNTYQKTPGAPLKFTSGIRAILEDSRGNIWFGSHSEGLAMLKPRHHNMQVFGVPNQTAFTYYNEKDELSHPQIRAIYEDENGHIWIETAAGISRYDGTKIKSYHLRNYKPPNTWQSYPNDLWFKGDQLRGYNTAEQVPGVYRYNGQRFTYHAFPIQYQAGEQNYYSVTTPFIKGKNNRLWFGTYGAVIGYQGTGTDFTIIDNTYLGLTKTSGFLHIRSLLEDSKGNLWIGNNGIGVLKYDGQNVIDFTAQHQLKKGDTQGNTLHRVFSIGEDPQGNIWFGTYQSGVWRYDGLLSEHIWVIYCSKQGKMWFGGANPSGVYQFNGTSFTRKF